MVISTSDTRYSTCRVVDCINRSVPMTALITHTHVPQPQTMLHVGTIHNLQDVVEVGEDLMSVHEPFNAFIHLWVPGTCGDNTRSHQLTRTQHSLVQCFTSEKRYIYAWVPAGINLCNTFMHGYMGDIMSLGLKWTQQELNPMLHI